MNKKWKLYIYGDPHGEYGPLIEACQDEQPDAVLILGDMSSDENPVSIKENLKPISEMGVQIMWVPGNHDTDSEAHFDASFGSMPDENINGRSVDLGDSGLRVAGLGGVFRGKIWYPEQDYEDPARHESQQALLANLPENEKFRGGLPLRHHTSIFRSDAENIRNLGADILISHEAPSSIEGGFLALDQLADDMNVKLIFHGHHHTSYEATLMNGIRVRGVGKREVVRIEF